jgi:O-antigen ligase
MSHWMTFSGHMMIALLLVTALVLHAGHRLPRRAQIAGIFCAILIGTAIVAGFTRSVWPAVAAGMLYLIWRWKPWVILTTPAVAAVLFLLAPEPVHRRIESAWNPSKLDSNDHRDALRRTGIRMIAAHPMVGVGPERIEARFLEHAPPDVPRPLPEVWYVKHLHNIYLQFAAERGIPAALALFWFLFQTAWDMIRMNPPAGGRFVKHAVLACLIGILVGGWWEHNLGDSEVLGALLSVIACGYSVREAEP